MLTELIIMFVFRAIPESFIYMYAMHVLGDAEIDFRKYIESSILLAIMMIFISKLPISYGIHTILIVMTIILIATAINNLNNIKCISIAIFNMIIQFIAEGINIFLIQDVGGRDIVKIMSQPITKVLFGTPSLIIFWGIVFALGKIRCKGKMNKNV